MYVCTLQKYTIYVSYVLCEEGHYWFFQISSQLESQENRSEFIAMLPPFGPLEGHKLFFQISRQ
jgi:hypothetical protein